MRKNGTIISKFVFFLKNYDLISRMFNEVVIMPETNKVYQSKPNINIEERYQEKIDNKRKKEIDNKVNEIRNTFQLPLIDLNLSEFLCTKEQFFIGTCTLEDNTTGMLIVDDHKSILDTKKNRVIILNDSRIQEEDFPQRARFITAHEYAHFVLHKHNESQIAFRDDGIYYNRQEQEAEYFARSLLMPEDVIRLIFPKIAISLTNQLVSYIAKLFNVTPKKAKQRLLELGYGK